MRRRIWAAAGMLLASASAIVLADEEVDLLQTDSLSPYVHRLTLYDEDGAAIDPAGKSPKPYSPRATCGKCHPYDQIRGGWHFNAADPNVPAGRGGEPWFVEDSQRGTWQPVSGRSWAGTKRPADVGLSYWDMVQRFGRQTPGGGYGEPTVEEKGHPPGSLRWGISGALEIDCMICHCANQQYDPAEVAHQIEAQNFKWSPTAAFGLAAVRGEARKVPDDFDPEAPPDPDRPQASGPKLVYDRSRFDADDRVLFEITRRPPNERCYFCHTVREVGEDAEGVIRPRDVHLAAGLACVDCHRNELDHMTVRGYPQEGRDFSEPERAGLSCEGCHLGVEGDEGSAAIWLGGLYGAPHPEHRGLPPLHLEKLTCPACHSGPWPGAQPRRFQTAMAHKLGLASRERSDDDGPFIFAPVFLREGDGRIGVQRIVWGTGGEPYSWSLAHDVRPATQSLGSGGCTDCHAAGAPLYYGLAAVEDAALESPGRAAPTMLALRGDDAGLVRAWNLGFVTRPAFKYCGFGCLGLVVLILLRNAATGFSSPRWSGARLRWVERLAVGVTVLATMAMGATGFGDELGMGELEGWRLLIHLCVAPLFIAGLTGLAWAGSPPSRFGAGGEGDRRGVIRRVLHWLVVASGCVVMGTMLAAMLPFFGYADQERLAATHSQAALVLMPVLAVYVVVSLATRGPRALGQGAS